MVMRDHKAPSTNCWPPRSDRVSETTEVFARDMFAKGMSKYVIEYMAYTYIYIYIHICIYGIYTLIYLRYTGNTTKIEWVVLTYMLV
jgi:hypothetical protein